MDFVFLRFFGQETLLQFVVFCFFTFFFTFFFTNYASHPYNDLKFTKSCSLRGLFNEIWIFR